ncbi:hypothetical protein like AT5G24600 [Hibiscus trionum]|uniref:Uncharacterized protein n=1 Tax=Hibiscus trionum TaxID=183268 RepID=A0A9W7ISW9_HIBTR|nr:hypothetical protein like AT5G24600 [Hibiscus trionum]
MSMEIKYLDCILFLLGILTMAVYHIWLFRKIIKHPTNTIIGVNAINRRFWVHSMMEDVGKNGVLAVQAL